jgi:hypothetical protein
VGAGIELKVLAGIGVEREQLIARWIDGPTGR